MRKTISSLRPARASAIAEVSFLDAGLARISARLSWGTISGPGHWKTLASSITTSQSSGRPRAARSRGWIGTRAPVADDEIGRTETM